MSDQQTSPLRVLHWPTDVGGHPSGLAQAERAIGLDSRVAVIRRGPFGYPVDLDLNLGHQNKLRRLVGRAAMLMQAMRDFDVIHLNFAQAFLPNLGSFGVDLPLLRQAGKKIFVTIQGCDARNPAKCPICASGQGPCALDESRRRVNQVSYAARHAQAVFCLNPDLLDAVPGSIFMPYASIDPAQITPAPPNRSSPRLRVVHAPTQRQTKGTEAVVLACQKLADRVELILVEGMPRDQALELYARADVIIDQLRLGWYGGLSVEAMALAKPVVCFLDPAQRALIPDAMNDELPIISTDRKTIESTLLQLVDMDPEALQSLGNRGRTFVERWHCPIALARWISGYYLNRPSCNKFDPERIEANGDLQPMPRPAARHASGPCH